MPYRLGADPERHGAVDCLSLTRAVLNWQGVLTPTPERHWYRRLRRGDFSIFPEELTRWGERVTAPRVGGTVALCTTYRGYALAVFWEGGFLHCLESAVRWSPSTRLPVAALYCPRK